MTETFRYDNLDRLDTVMYGNTVSPMVYDTYGRMTQRTRMDNVVFNNAEYDNQWRPHAVLGADVNSTLSPANQTIAYNMHDKVRGIQQDRDVLTIDYGYDRQRMGMTDYNYGLQTTTSKLYVGSCEFNRGVSRPQRLTYISGPLGVFAVYEELGELYKGDGDDSGGDDPTDSSFTGALYYVYRDHLGSVTAITDATGSVVQELSYDAWGNLRNPNNWSIPFTGTPKFDRGYTGHEHLTRYGLINMKFTLSESSAKLCLSTAERSELGEANGRVYDPLMCCFLSVDTYVQDPGSAQNFNRYAYCMYNPLKYTDPDGEWIQYVIGGLLGAWNGYSIGKAAGLNGWKLVLSTISGAGVGVVTCGIGNYFTSVVGPGFGSVCGGAMSGFGNGLISGVANHSENPLGDALIGCVKGIASSYVGALASVTFSSGDSWGCGAFLGGAASNVTSQLLSYDWKSEEQFSWNWKSTLFSAGLSWGIYYGSSYMNYKKNIKTWNPAALKITFGQYLRIQGMYTRARFWRSEQKGGGFWLTRDGVSDKNVFYNEKENTVSFGIPKPNGAIATVHAHPYDESNVGQEGLWHSEADLNNVINHQLPSIVVNKYGVELAVPSNGDCKRFVYTDFWGSSFGGYGKPYFLYPYTAAPHYFNLRP